MSGLICVQIESGYFSPFLQLCRPSERTLSEPPISQNWNSWHFQFTFAVLSDGWFSWTNSGSTELTLNIRLDLNENLSRAYLFVFISSCSFSKLQLKIYPMTSIKVPPLSFPSINIIIAPSSKEAEERDCFLYQTNLLLKISTLTFVSFQQMWDALCENVWHFCWTILRRLFFNLALAEWATEPICQSLSVRRISDENWWGRRGRRSSNGRSLSQCVVTMLSVNWSGSILSIKG